MKLTKMAFAAAVAALLWGRGVAAEEPVYESSHVGTSTAGIRTLLSDEATSEGILALPTGYSVMAGGDADGACDVDCGPNCCKLADLGEPFKLFDGCAMQSRGIQAGGWIAQSFTWNPYSPNDRFNGPVTWTDRSNDYQLNEIYAFAGRAANTEGCGWDWGWRADALFGSNYRWDTAAGLESKWNSHAFYGVALPQFYAEVAHNDVTVKVGHFVSPVGFYTVGTANNFFAYIPYTYQYGEPFTHTGALATWKVSDKLSWGNGITHGWDNFDNTGNPHAGYLGTLSYTFDNADTLAWVGLFGQEPNLSGTSGGFSDRYFQTLVYTHKFADDVTGVLQSDFGGQKDGVRAGQYANWYGVNTYLYWRQSCRLQWGINAEWFRDENGFRVGQVVPSLASPAARGLAQGPGFQGNFWQVGVGPKYYITPNMYTRLNARFDWYGGSASPAGTLPFDDGTKTHQAIGIWDLVITF